MPSQFENEQRWQLLIATLVLWGIPALLVILIAAGIGFAVWLTVT